MIEIDCSHGEGGGQVIRTSLSLSAITQKPVRLFNIRAKRSNPGLQPQHLMACKATRSICRGTLDGAELASKELTFHPGEIVGGKYDFNIGTAGSVILVAQTVLPILFHASKPSVVRITGGTHVLKSPSFDYFEKTFVPAITAMGANIKTRMLKPGYYPKGGGEIEIELEPSTFTGKDTWGKEDEIQALIRLSDLPETIAIREKKIFLENGTERVYVRNDAAANPGNAVFIWQDFRGSYVVGERGKRAEVVAGEAITQLKKERESDIDCHLADQILLYAFLASGTTRFKTSELTSHFMTNKDIISRFIERTVNLDSTTVSVL